MLTIAAVVLTSAALGGQPYEIGGINPREALLVTPRPYPAYRVDSPDRLENGRIWYPRTFTNDRSPVREERYGSNTAADYGAHPHLNQRIIYTHVEHQVIAISPWAKYGIDHEADSTPHYRRAANRWLRENGYTLKVRTHVNSRYLDQHVPSREMRMRHVSLDSSDIDPNTRLGPDGLPLPRATIKIERIEKPKVDPRAQADDSIRIFKPAIAPYVGPAIASNAHLVQLDAPSTDADAKALEAQDNSAELSLVNNNE